MDKNEIVDYLNTIIKNLGVKEDYVIVYDVKYEKEVKMICSDFRYGLLC